MHEMIRKQSKSRSFLKDPVKVEKFGRWNRN